MKVHRPEIGPAAAVARGSTGRGRIGHSDRMDILSLLGFLGACFVAASTGAIFRPGAWYEGLAKPPWRPPNWLFGPAWALLYALIAISAWLVWRADGFGTALVIWSVHLVINAGWSAVFFGLRRPDLAFAWILLLWASIAVTIAAFAPVSLLAAWLLAPYLLWVSFATALNVSIWRRNPRPA